MTKSLKWRAVMIVTVIAVALMYLGPTLGTVPVWWEDNLPSEKISLGLDLQGGMHLLMEVEADKAVENTVERYAADFEDLLFEERIPFDHVAKVGPRKIEVAIIDPATQEKFEELVKKRFSVLKRAGRPVKTDDAITYALEIDAQEAEYIAKLAIDQAIETIRNRIDQFGVSEPVIQKHGAERILIQLPGVKDPERAIDLIGKTAILEFKLVDDEHDVQEALKGTVPNGSQVLYQRQVDSKTGEVKKIPFLLKKRTLLTGDRLVNAQVRIDSRFNDPYVSLEFDKRGGKIFERITGKNIKKRLAIILDNNVYSAPVIQDRIAGGSAQITGRFSMEEARDLAIVLRAGSLPAPVKILEKRQVGPSLGKDSIDQGVKSIMIGGIAVILFILMYYQLSGIVANIALVLNVVLILAALAAFRATLTLPGIAGMVLTIGMAIDANVLIFERTREELRLGKTPRAAIDSGYSKALITILDSNITTLIAAIFLFQFGTGPIKGFAVTLSIGILASLFTAIVVSRTVFDYFLENKRIKSLSI
ncbi:MAG: protein translocase subunit SecD [Deltaproteobacteria bacterium]|nr:protein translocase subunit SecD [Deltaproteobacteria bacterium]